MTGIPFPTLGKRGSKWSLSYSYPDETVVVEIDHSWAVDETEFTCEVLSHEATLFLFDSSEEYHEAYEVAESYGENMDDWLDKYPFTTEYKFEWMCCRADARGRWAALKFLVSPAVW